MRYDRDPRLSEAITSPRSVREREGRALALFLATLMLREARLTSWTCNHEAWPRPPAPGRRATWLVDRQDALGSLALVPCVRCHRVHWLHAELPTSNAQPARRHPQSRAHHAGGGAVKNRPVDRVRAAAGLRGVRCPRAGLSMQRPRAALRGGQAMNQRALADGPGTLSWWVPTPRSRVWGSKVYGPLADIATTAVFSPRQNP